MYVLYPADGDVLQPDSPIRYDGRLYELTMRLI